MVINDQRCNRRKGIEEKAGLDVKGLIFIGIIMFLIPILKNIFSN